MSDIQQDKNQRDVHEDQAETINTKTETTLKDDLDSSIYKIDLCCKDLNSKNSLTLNEEDQRFHQENVYKVQQFEETNHYDDQVVSIFKIQRCFYDINKQNNLVNTLKKKANIQISEFEIFFQNLETILNCNAQNIDCIKKLGQKLSKEYVQAFNQSNIYKLIQEYMSNPKKPAQDQVQIQQEFIRFSNENKFQQMIEEDTEYESDSNKIFDLCKDQILNNQFQAIEQVQNLSENFNNQILKAYSLSKLSEMINIYQKIQSILQGKHHSENLQKPILENQNFQCQTSNDQIQTLEQSKLNEKTENKVKIIPTINNKELNHGPKIQKIQLIQQNSFSERNTENQNILDDNKLKPQDQVLQQINKTKQNDEEIQRETSQQSEEVEEVVKKLKQILKPGENAPKKMDYYNTFIRDIAELLLKKLPSQSIEEYISQYFQDSHVNKVMELISEVINEKKNSDKDGLIINIIKQQIPLFSQALNDEQIYQMVQQMKGEGFQSSLFKQYCNGNYIIEKKLFDIHQQLPFLNVKTYQVCQLYFKAINFQISDIESQLIIDQYFIKIQQNQEYIQKNIERFKQIEQIISSNTSIRKYLEQIYALSLKKKLLDLFNLSEAKLNEKFITKKLINQDNSQNKLQEIIEKYKLNKTLEDFQILEQIFQSNQFNSIYFKSLLLVEINKAKDDQQFYFSEIYQFLLELQSQGLKILFNQQFQQLIKLIKINENILNAKDFENLDQYYIQLLLFACTENEKKIELIKFILKKQLSNFQIDEDQLQYISKQIHRTGLVFISQLNEQRINFVKDIDQKLSKCELLKNIYGRNLYDLEDQTMKFYFDFERQVQIQNQRDEIFKIDKFIDVNQLLEYHNSQQKVTQIETWIKDVANLYINSDSLFSSKLYDLIIYLSKRNQNLDIVFQKLQEHLMKNQSKQNRFLINKKIVFEYLMEYSDNQAQFKLMLMMGFANPVPLLRTKLIKMKDNVYTFQQQLQYQSFWLLKQQDYVVASLGIGFQKGKSSLLNDLFATNFAISDNSYSFVSSADLQSNHIFQQNKRKYFVADFHGDASLLDEQYILGFFVYYILQVNISQIQNNKINDLERIIKLLEKNNKKYCILIRDFEENSQFCANITNSNQQNQIFAWLDQNKVLTLPNLKLIDEEKKIYHLNQTRITLDSLINGEPYKQFSLNLFIERFFSIDSIQNQIKQPNQINNELMYQTYQKVNYICDKLQQINDIKGSKLFKVYRVFSKYQKIQMEYSDRKFKQSSEEEIIKRSEKFEKYQSKYNNLKINNDRERSEATNLFETIICDAKNLYNNMLFFVQKLKDVNNQRVGYLKEEKRNLIDQVGNDKIQKIQKLDQLILDKQISVELFWREIIQLWQKHPNYSKNSQLIEAYANMIYNGFPFEIIDGETFYYPFEFLEQCFEHSNFTDKKFCIISIIGPQNSGKSTLLNYFLGCDFHVSDGRCTRGIYGTLVKSKIPEFDYILVIDSEGLLSQEKDDPDYDRMLTLFCLSVSQFLIINVKDQLTPEMTKILELCVEVSSDLKANQIPKRVVEIVFNQKADPNNENNKVAINNALKSFEQNAKLSDHIEINNENASNLPNAFSYKYIDVGQQQKNWNYLETQITFVEGVQNLGDKIIQKLINLSQQEQQKTFKLVKSIPELLKLMKDIYETINQNSDLTAYKDILHKQNDLKVKQFIKKMINDKINETFSKDLNKIFQAFKEQNQNLSLQNQINEKFDYLENEIKQNVELEFKNKVLQEIIIQNNTYLNKQIQIQKDNYISNISQDKQSREQQQWIKDAIDRILSLAKEQTQKKQDDQIKCFNDIFDYEVKQIKMKQQNQEQKNKQQFQFIQTNYKLYLKENLNIQSNDDYVDENDINEIIKIGSGLVHFQKNSNKNQQFDEMVQNLNYPLIQSKLLYNIYQIFCIRLQFCQLEKITFSEVGNHVHQNSQNVVTQIHSYQNQVSHTHQIYQKTTTTFMLDDKLITKLLQRLKDNYGISINKNYIKDQYNYHKKPTDLLDFYNIGNECKMVFNLEQDKNLTPQNELNKLKSSVGIYLEETHKKWYDYFAFWTTKYDIKKNELEKMSQCNYLKMDSSYFTCFISWLKQQLQQYNCSIILNFKQYIQNINDQIKQNISNQKISKVDKEVISKIASIVKKNIQEANSNLNIFDLQLTAQAENRLNMLAIQQLYKQDKENIRMSQNKPIKQFESKKLSFQNYFLEYAQKDQVIDKQSAIQFKIMLQQFCQDTFQQFSDAIVNKSLEEYENELSKESLIKIIQSQFINITKEKASKYIQDPNKVILEEASLLSQQHIKQVQQKIDEFKKQLINQVQIILKSLSNIKTEQLLPEKDKKGLIANQIFITQFNSQSFPNIEQSQIAYQKFIFQVLLNEEENIQINDNQIIVDLQRPQYLQINDQETKKLLIQFINQNKSFFDQMQIKCVEQFFNQFEDIVNKDRLFDNMNEFQTKDIKKEFFTINDYLTCDFKCPCCAQVCDQDHWKYNQDARGKGQNKHTIKCGHRFAAFNGVKIDKENIPALITCLDYEDDTSIKYQGQLLKWSIFKQNQKEWDWQANSEKEKELSRQKWQKIWSIVGKDICQKHNINYLEVCTPQIIQKCKQQINPMHFIIAFDESGSMNGKNWQDLRVQLENFINLRFDKSVKDVCSLIGFNSQAHRYTLFENLNKQIIQKIPKQNNGGGTCYSTVFSLILQILNHQQNENFIENTIIFFLSDGIANKPVQEIQQLLTKNKLIKEVQFIGFGNNDFNVLQQMVTDLQILNASFKKVLDSEQLSQQFQNLSLIIPS